MYKLPADTLRNIKNKYPDISNMEEIINDIFEEIREKSINDGSCTINKLGTFYTYKALSQKKNTFVPRFKFRISRSFANKLAEDSYILQRIQKTINRIFDKEKEENEDYIRNRNLNYENHMKILQNQSKINKKIKENLQTDEISNILQEEF